MRNELNIYFVVILDGFSVACEGEDKFAVAREGKLKMFSKNNLLYFAK
jgi:hypothetical protein